MIEKQLMKTDFYIKLNAEADMPTVLSAFYRQDTTTEVDGETGEETVINVGDPYIVSTTHDYAIDIVGVIYKATGVMLTDPEANDYPETAPLDGYHLNIRLLNDTMREAAEAVNAEYGVAVNSPSRTWA